MQIKKQIPIFYCSLGVIAFCLAAWQPLVRARPKTAAAYFKDSIVTISISGNGYLYPANERDTVTVIDSLGLSAWSNPAQSIRVYFYPTQTGILNLSLRLHSPTEGAELEVSDQQGQKRVRIPVPKSTENIDLPVGSFMIDSGGYHYFEISGIRKSGTFFPGIQSVVLSGATAATIQYNTSDYRGAASTHLRYQAPVDSGIAWFYTEVNIPPGRDADNAYYETNGFADGYMGIQVNSPTERRIIFSVWSNFKTDDPKQIPADYAVRLLKKGSDSVVAEDFGNEGSGGHSHLVFPWKNGTTYKLLVGAKVAGDHTIFSGYYYDEQTSSGNLLAQWDKSKTGGRLLSRMYAFVENFGPNGNDYFEGRYGNQWVYTTAGHWMEITRCQFTTTASSDKHPRYDYGAGIAGNWFYMFTGGFKKMNNLLPKSMLERRPGQKAPEIDFNRLPGQ